MYNINIKLIKNPTIKINICCFRCLANIAPTVMPIAHPGKENRCPNASKPSLILMLIIIYVRKVVVMASVKPSK